MSEAEVEQNPSSKTPEGQGSVVPLGWKPNAAQPVPVVRCVQIKKDGERCKQWSLRGYTKCYRHAGPGVMKDGNVSKYADAVVEAARLRLVGDTDKALDVLNELLQPGSSEGIRLKAATEVLDRAGVRGGFEVKVEAEVNVNPAEVVSERLAKLAEGAQAVKKMREESLASNPDTEADIIDAEVVPDDDQETLF